MLRKNKQKDQMERKKMKAKPPSQLTVLSLQKYFYPVHKFPWDRAIIQYPVFVTAR
jgi:hypothetical protein